MKTLSIPTALAVFASVASVGNLHAQQTTTQGINQREAAATNNLAAGQPNQKQGAVPLTQVIVQKLQKANDAEIELANLALQRSDNEQLKQFAQMLVKEHQACNQKLRESSGLNIGNNRSSDVRQSQTTPDTRENTPNARDENRVAQNTPRTDTGAKAGENTEQKNAARGEGRREGAEAGNRNAMVPGQLVQIMDQACDTSLNMTKEMLQKYEGQDFAMAFLGQQCVAHMMMLAELQAIQSHGPEELKSLAGEAAEKVQTHLDKAKQLAKQLEDDRATTRAASR